MPASRNTPPWSRPLGFGECFYWQIDQAACINFVAYAEVSGALSETALADGLAALQAAHPLLAAAVVVEQDRPHFQATAAAAELIRVNATAEAFAASRLAELNRPFASGSGPLFRCHWASDGARGWVALTLHHAVGDGRVGLRLLIELLRFLALGERPAPCPLPSALDAFYAPARYQQPDKATHLAHLLADLQRRAAGVVKDSPLPGGAGGDRALRYRQHRLTAPAAEALRRACRAHATTVHGALGAAYLKAVRDEFYAADAAPILSLSSPVDLRPHTPLPEGAAMYIGAINSRLRVAPDQDLWALARALNADIHAQVQAGHAHLLYDLVFARTPPSAAPGAAEALRERIRRNPWNAMLTNVGAQPVPALGEAMSLDRLGFAVSPLANQLIAMAATGYQGLQLDTTYDAAEVPAERAEAVLARLWEIVETAAR